MRIYLDLCIGMNAMVVFLLLSAAGELSGAAAAMGRLIPAALLGGIYGGICLIPGFSFLGNGLWRGLFLALMCITAFGWHPRTGLAGGLFLLLSLGLGGLAMGTGIRNLPALGLGLLGWLMLYCCSRPGLQRVEICHGEKNLTLTALRDTGNTLRDPITGERVLILSAKAAGRLTGLTEVELRSPIQTLAAGKIPGLRLIPYRSVGGSGLLLGLRLDQVKVDGRRGSTLAAFAPEGLGDSDGFQALSW